MIINGTPEIKDNVIIVNLPATSEYVSIARLSISGIASRLNFTVEDIEDIKIAVSEACTNAVQHAYENHAKTGRIEVKISTDEEKLEISVRDFGSGFNIGILGTEEQKKRSEEKLGLGLGLTFIKNLMDEVEIQTIPNEGTCIRMTKLRPLQHHISAIQLQKNQPLD